MILHLLIPPYISLISSSPNTIPFLHFYLPSPLIQSSSLHPLSIPCLFSAPLPFPSPIPSPTPPFPGTYPAAVMEENNPGQPRHQERKIRFHRFPREPRGRLQAPSAASGNRQGSVAIGAPPLAFPPLPLLSLFRPPPPPSPLLSLSHLPSPSLAFPRPLSPVPSLTPLLSPSPSPPLPTTCSSSQTTFSLSPRNTK